MLPHQKIVETYCKESKTNTADWGRYLMTYCDEVIGVYDDHEIKDVFVTHRVVRYLDSYYDVLMISGQIVNVRQCNDIICLMDESEE